jgi:cell division protein FtsB
VWLAFGDSGFLNLYRIERERQNYQEKIRRLNKENRFLLEEIIRLRTDTQYLESIARRELNLVKENEVMYRFKAKKPRNRITLKVDKRGSAR